MANTIERTTAVTDITAPTPKHFEAVCVSAVRDKQSGGVTAIYRGENGKAGFYLYSAGYSPSTLLGDRKRIAVDGSEIVSFTKPRTGELAV